MTDEELIAHLRLQGLDKDIAAADRIEALVKVRREDALELLAAHGQAQDAYEAQLKAEARAERLEAALRETTQILRQCTFQCILVGGQYLDREEVVSRSDAALEGAKP